MKAKRVHVKKFRCLQDASIDIENLTILVGPNGSGKSCFLHALDLFYSSGARIAEGDFYNHDTTKEIEIAVTFSGLDDAEKELFAAYMDGETLTVTKAINYTSGRPSERLYGTRLQFPGFLEIRQTSAAREKQVAYNALREQAEFSSLPSVRRADQIEEHLKAWETQNPGRCERLRDDGQFFGWTGVGKGNMRRHTRFVLVRAVREATQDGGEARGSALGELLELVVKGKLAEKAEIREFRERATQEYRELHRPENLPELPSLEEDLSEILQTYAPNASVSLSWEQIGDLDIPIPGVRTSLVEDGFEGDISRKGHGLQRAFIISLMHHLAMVSGQKSMTEEESEEAATEESGATGVSAPQKLAPDLLIAIEEPELYQHPNRQRHLARVLAGLASRPVEHLKNSIQIIYATHSPYFVDIDHFNGVRLIRKEKIDSSLPPAAIVSSVSLDRIGEEIRSIARNALQITEQSTRGRLKRVLSPAVNEGFFANVVVLVEGDEDKAVLTAEAERAGHDFEALGISVLPVNGKGNLDKPLIVFSGLGIPTYVLFDGDRSKGANGHPDQNESLLRLLGEASQLFPETVVKDRFSCFTDDLMKTLLSELGEGFQAALDAAASGHGFAGSSEGRKNPSVLRDALDTAAAQGRESETIKGIGAKIMALTQARRSPGGE